MSEKACMTGRTASPVRGDGANVFQFHGVEVWKDGSLSPVIVTLMPGSPIEVTTMLNPEAFEAPMTDTTVSSPPTPAAPALDSHQISKIVAGVAALTCVMILAVLREVDGPTAIQAVTWITGIFMTGTAVLGGAKAIAGAIKG
jgi:hypothetical protein